MNNVRKKFTLYAMLSVFALLTVLLSIINGINFTMASTDADMLTQTISERHGTFNEHKNKKKNDEPKETSDEPQFRPQPGDFGAMGPMGLSSPEMESSLRYITYAFNDKGEGKEITFKLSAVDEDTAYTWAESLLNEKPVGWTKWTYRYRVYTEGKKTYVTIIDQGRELLPCYRILMISVWGEIIGLVISYFVLRSVGKKLFAPLEEADAKQKRFISNIESEFKLPLTVINADTELIEREFGINDNTKSINRQVRKMTALVKDIGSLAIFEEEGLATTVNLSSTLGCIIDENKPKFIAKNISVKSSIEEDITVNCEDERIRVLFGELVKNALRYSLTNAEFTLKRHGDRITLTASNDTDLKNGTIEQVFDRFIVLENADDKSVGLGLSHVRDTVWKLNGRISAKVTDGRFVLTITL